MSFYVPLNNTHTMENQSKVIIHLSFMASFDYVKMYHKNDEDIGISPDPTRVKPFELYHPYQPITLLTEVAIRPKSVSFCGSYVERWNVVLN